MPFVQNLLRLKTAFLNTAAGASPDMTFDGSVKDDNLDDSSNVKKCHASSMDRLDIDFMKNYGMHVLVLLLLCLVLERGPFTFLKTT
jgi:hypothetical protein